MNNPNDEKKIGALIEPSAFWAQNGTMPRLEDLINVLIDLDRGAGASFAPKRSETSSYISQSARPVAAASEVKVELPSDVRTELCLPAQADEQYQTLLVFCRMNRHNPFIMMASGRVLYVEYDDEMERIRLFMGDKKRMRRMEKSAFETGVHFIIDEVHEFLMQRGKDDSVVETNRQGRELLSKKEDADPSIKPVLDAALFSRSKDGVSSCKVRCGLDLGGLSWMNH